MGKDSTFAKAMAGSPIQLIKAANDTGDSSYAPLVFVADAFVEDNPHGGAELTSEAIFEGCPFSHYRIHTRDLTREMIIELKDRYWIFGNFFEINTALFPPIIAFLKYSVIEYDYKYCRYRSPRLHELSQGSPCQCVTHGPGLVVSDFFRYAQTLWWMSEGQMRRYHNNFPLMRKPKNFVLSSVFSESSLELIRDLRSCYPLDRRRGWLVVGSPNWIKNAEGAKAWCREQNLPFEVVWGIPHAELLHKLAQSEGLVFLPMDFDTCPRLIIEAKLLGCKLHCNEYVQHAKESWFDTDNFEQIELYLKQGPYRFWTVTVHDIQNSIPALKQTQESLSI